MYYGIIVRKRVQTPVVCNIHAYLKMNSEGFLFFVLFFVHFIVSLYFCYEIIFLLYLVHKHLNIFQ